MSDERDNVEETSHVKLAITMNGCSEWLINSTNDDTCGGVRDASNIDEIEDH